MHSGFLVPSGKKKFVVACTTPVLDRVLMGSNFAVSA